MKGIIFNLLELLVEGSDGEEAWESVLASHGSAGVYTALGSYEDEELFGLVQGLANHRYSSPDDVLRWFGKESIPVLRERYPEFFDPHTSVVSFMLSLNDVIHAEVRKLYPGADVPVFDFEVEKPERDNQASCQMRMVYHSHRSLCALAEGFTLGAARYFLMDVEIEHQQCKKAGASACDFALEFRPT